MTWKLRIFLVLMTLVLLGFFMFFALLFDGRITRPTPERAAPSQEQSR